MVNRALLVLTIAIQSTDASAALDLGTHLFVSVIPQGRSTLSAVFKSYNYLYLSGGAVSGGPFILFDQYQTDVRDIGYGGGLRFGSDFFFGLAGGALTRHHTGATARGLVGGIMLGKHLTKNVHVVVPIFGKKITSGNLLRGWEVNYLPYLGLRLEL